MNAYKLADELQKHGLNGDNYGLFNKRIQNMLRQQADRIAELEKQLDLHKNAHHKCVEILQQKQSEPVAWFDGEHYVCPEIGYEYTITTEHPKTLGWKPLYTTPQTKPLSDEEIRQCILDYFESPEYKLFPLPTVSVQFARAVEAKVRGEK